MGFLEIDMGFCGVSMDFLWVCCEMGAVFLGFLWLFYGLFYGLSMGCVCERSEQS